MLCVVDEFSREALAIRNFPSWWFPGFTTAVEVMRPEALPAKPVAELGGLGAEAAP